jgi:exodeoxyribonuclease VII large subunit
VGNLMRELNLWGEDGEEKVAVSEEATRSKPPTPEVLTVGALTRELRRLLEREVGEVWLKGEVSNFRNPGSGHLYFSLKDDEAVIQAVMFRGAAAGLSFRPMDGLAVQVFGRITVYEQRGQYQIVVESMEPQGKGTLQERFEALKRRLAAEGFFELERKRTLPLFPESVGIVTSLQGAVLQDFCRVLGRRAPGILIQVYGCRVQGLEAAGEIAAGVAEFNRRDQVDVIVVARGGGSLEDLWAFNEEIVVRALAASRLPTISAVGHETDFTLADFVADLRAPTPSAAAELLSRDWNEWREEVRQWELRWQRAWQQELAKQRELVERLASSYVFREPVRVVQQWQQRIDDLTLALTRALRDGYLEQQHAWEKLLLRWQTVHPQRLVREQRDRVEQWEARLRALGPEATLTRGYALVTDEQGTLIRNSDQVAVGQVATIRLGSGKLDARVESKNT